MTGERGRRRGAGGECIITACEEMLGLSNPARPASADDAAAPVANAMVERITACEEMLGLSNGALSLPQRVAAAEELALGERQSGALPSRLAAIENAVGLKTKA